MLLMVGERRCPSSRSRTRPPSVLCGCLGNPLPEVRPTAAHSPRATARPAQLTPFLADPYSRVNTDPSRSRKRQLLIQDQGLNGRHRQA